MLGASASKFHLQLAARGGSIGPGQYRRKDFSSVNPAWLAVQFLAFSHL